MVYNENYRKDGMRRLFRYFKHEKDFLIDEQIAMVLDKMKEAGPESAEYPTLLSTMERLFEMKAKARPNPVSRDTVAIVAGNLLGILLIVAYEQKHVMTSKGLNQIIRPNTPK